MSSFLSKTKEFRSCVFCLYCLVLGCPKDRFRATMQTEQMIQVSLVEVALWAFVFHN